MRATLTLLLLAAVAAASTPERTSPSPLSTSVESYVREAEMRHLDGGPRFVSAAAGGGALGWLHLRASFWVPSLDGKIAADGERLDFRNDLGLDETQGAVVPEVLLSLGSVVIHFDAFFLEIDGQNTINRAFTFGGVTFLVSEDVTSHVKIDHYRLLGTFPIVKTDFLELRTQGGIQLFDLDGTVEGSTSGTSRASGALPIPVVGLLAQVKIKRLLLEVDVAGLTIDFGDVEGTVLDARASIGIMLFKVLAVRGGYRLVLIDGSASDISVDARLQGFFVGASFSF